MNGDYDVVIIGAGDVGSAIARELAAFALKVVVVDAGDVGGGTSKANTAILHSGFDAKPGTLEARLVARGHDLLLDYAGDAGIPLERTGALLVAWEPEQVTQLPLIEARARANGYSALVPLAAPEIYRREPHLGPGALAGLYVPDEFIVCPWTAPLAWATQAALAGVELQLHTRVEHVQRDGARWRILTTRGELGSRWIVNAAGLFGDELHAQAGFDGLTITPRRGELMVFDKLARPLVSQIVLPVPTETTKGVLVAPTVFGNVLLGPTAQDIVDKHDTSCTAGGLAYLREQGARLMPELLEHEVTATYAGLRAASEHPDYLLLADGTAGYACAGGIRSTGLTGAMAIAEWMRDALEREGLGLRERPGGLPDLRMPNIGEATPRPYQSEAMIAGDPAYGEIVCFCERVTRGEIRDAACGAIAPQDLDGLRRRTRSTMGRCQGFYCEAAVTRELAARSGVPPRELRGLA